MQSAAVHDGLQRHEQPDGKAEQHEENIYAKPTAKVFPFLSDSSSALALMVSRHHFFL